MAKILVIDDEDQIRRYLRRILERAGYEVLEAADGLSGLKTFDNEPADLIITDLIMPEKEGMELIMKIRTDAPEVKIIAISGGGEVLAEDYLTLARGLGAISTLPKPFSRQEMLDAVADALS